MVNILILGATGFIGLPTALALRRNGHRVWGVTRSQASAQNLQRQEITPIICSLADEAVWASAIISNRIDIVLDISSSGPSSLSVLRAVQKVSAQTGRAEGAKLGYVYYSGTWTAGNYPAPTITSDSIAPNTADCPKLVAWRAEVEKEVLKARDDLEIVIIRPALLFGGAGSYFGQLFEPVIEAKERGEKTVEVLYRDGMSFGLIHKEDLAELAVKLVDKYSVVAGIGYPLFNVTGFQEPGDVVIKAVVKRLGYEGEVKYRKESNDMEEAMMTSGNLSCDRAKSYLDWQPRHTCFFAQADVYVDTIVAHLRK